MSMPKKIYAARCGVGWDEWTDILIGEQTEYNRADLVNDLIDAIENFQCSGGLSIAIKGSIKAIRGEQ